MPFVVWPDGWLDDSRPLHCCTTSCKCYGASLAIAKHFEWVNFDSARIRGMQENIVNLLLLAQ